MKNLLLLMTLLVQIQIFGQGLKGKVQVGGSASYTVNDGSTVLSNTLYTTAIYEESVVFLVTPQIGYFVGEYISTGLKFGFSDSQKTMGYYSNNPSIDPAPPAINNSSAFSIGPYFRFHKPINEQFYLFAQLDVNVAFGKNGDLYQFIRANSDILAFEIGLRPGLLILFSEKFGLESSFGFLGYHLVETTVKDNSGPSEPYKEDSYGLDLDLRNFNLGLQYYF